MKALYDFIVEPLGERYANKIKISNKELILNSNIENHKFVNILGKVISIPKNIDTDIKTNDLVVLHHNVFRRFYDVRGNEKNSRSYFKDNKYFVSTDQIFMYIRDGIYKSFMNRCFVKPIDEPDNTKLENLKYRYGIVKYSNKELSSLNIFKNDVINFRPKREFEFTINNELLYCMKSNDIIIKHEHKGNQEENYPCGPTCSEGINKSCSRTDCGHGGRCECGSFEECCCN